MIDLDFAVSGVEVARRSAVPLLLFKLHITTAPGDAAVEHITLQAQIRIEAAHRDYSQDERARLFELFGPPTDWNRTLQGLFWANAGVAISRFTGECRVDLPVPCSYDFNIAATKYFHGLQDGAAPLSLLLSGAIFFRNEEGDLQIAQIAHHKEARCRLPVQLWRSMMDHYYPDGVWLCIDRDLFDAVQRYKFGHGFSTLDEALRRLVSAEKRR